MSKRLFLLLLFCGVVFYLSQRQKNSQTNESASSEKLSNENIAHSIRPQTLEKRKENNAHTSLLDSGTGGSDQKRKSLEAEYSNHKEPKAENFVL